MFFALLTKNRESNMATPEQTRDRIKAMRDRIFKDTNKDSNGNKIQENPQEKDLAEIKPKILEPSEALPSDPKPAKDQEGTSSEKQRKDEDQECLQFGICSVQAQSPRPEELYFG